MKKRVDELAPGTAFLSSTGEPWVFVRKDGALSGAYHCDSADGLRHTTFAGCAEVHVGEPEIGEVFGMRKLFGLGRLGG